MNKKLIGVAVLLAAALAPTRSGAQNAVQKTADTCANAHAVLLVGADGNHARYWEAIYNVAKNPLKWWRIVDDYTPMVSMVFSFRQYDTRFFQGGTAYVAHCGSGATCNELAEEVLKHYPDSGSPRVYCGEVPYLLENPQSPGVTFEPLERGPWPIPTAQP
jgi:hypothetical protein